MPCSKNSSRLGSNMIFNDIRQNEKDKNRNQIRQEDTLSTHSGLLVPQTCVGRLFVFMFCFLLFFRRRRGGGSDISLLPVSCQDYIYCVPNLFDTMTQWCKQSTVDISQPFPQITHIPYMHMVICCLYLGFFVYIISHQRILVINSYIIIRVFYWLVCCRISDPGQANIASRCG